MAREDTPLDQETFDKVLADELGKGTDRRVAEGRAFGRGPRVPSRPRRARSSAPPRRPRPTVRGPATEGSKPGCGPPQLRSGRGSGSGRRAGWRTAVATMPAPQAPAPTGNVPEPKKGAREAPAPRARASRGHPARRTRAGRPVNVWPHLLIEEFIALLVVLAGLTIFSTVVNAPCASSRTRT